MLTIGEIFFHRCANVFERGLAIPAEGGPSVFIKAVLECDECSKVLFTRQRTSGYVPFGSDSVYDGLQVGAIFAIPNVDEASGDAASGG